MYAWDKTLSNFWIQRTENSLIIMMNGTRYYANVIFLHMFMQELLYVRNLIIRSTTEIGFQQWTRAILSFGINEDVYTLKCVYENATTIHLRLYGGYDDILFAGQKITYEGVGKIYAYLVSTLSLDILDDPSRFRGTL